MFVCYNELDNVYLLNNGSCKWSTTPRISKATKRGKPDTFLNVIKGQFADTKDQWSVVDLDKATATPLEETEHDSRIETLENGELVKVISVLQSVQSVMNQETYLMLQQKQSDLDKELSDIYHHIETSNCDLYHAWLFYKKLKNVLIQRRDVKDTLNIYLRFSQSKEPIYQTISTVMEKMTTRNWSQRCFEKKENVE